MRDDTAPLTPYNQGYLAGARWAVSLVLKILTDRGHDELAKAIREKFEGRRVIE
jgi:hypothetical protein